MSIGLLTMGLAVPALAFESEDATALQSAYLRRDTSAVSQRIAQIPQGAAVTIQEEQGSWCLVDYNGQQGWVAQTVLRAQSTGEDSTALPGTDSAETVGQLQELLQELGYFPDECDGVYSMQVTEALCSYQRANGFEETGVADRKTINAMLAEKQLIKQVVAQAMAQLGVRYRRACASPENGFDCSGLTCYAYRQIGYTISRASRGQMSEGVEVQPENLRPGDLLIFRRGGHVAMYVGNGLYIHAPYTGEVVKLQPMGRQYTTIRRIIGGAP
ncbi:MAG: C40 family peptidase [Eubacteriales bacterium]|nr:C40 family peptidase [Eubacteriales bacterium]